MTGEADATATLWRTLPTTTLRAAGHRQSGQRGRAIPPTTTLRPVSNYVLADTDDAIEQAEVREAGEADAPLNNGGHPTSYAILAHGFQIDHGSHRHHLHLHQHIITCMETWSEDSSTQKSWFRIGESLFPNIYILKSNDHLNGGLCNETEVDSFV